MKKVLLILGILVIVVAVGIFVLKPDSSQNPNEDGGFNFSLKDFLPFGQSSDSEEEGVVTEREESGEERQTTSDQVNNDTHRLRKISSEPVSGAIIFNTGTTSIVRFVEKGTGNVYEVKSNSTQIERLTNTTIPKIVRAYWLPDGSGFLAQTIIPDTETVETSFVKLRKNTSTSTASEQLTPFATTISKLPTDIKEFSIKQDGSKVFYYTTENSTSNWYVSNPDGTNRSLVYTSPLTEWLPKWSVGNTVFMQNKSSGQTVGYIYSFDVNTKILRKVGNGAFGISTNLNTDASSIFISSGGSSVNSSVLDLKTGVSSALSLQTLADKCVWLNKTKSSAYCAVPNNLPNGLYPDDWYRGSLSTEDSIIKAELGSDIYYNNADLSELSKQQVDVSDIKISPDDSHIIFKNKIDGYLWLLRMEE